jgi:hypothetical protein
VGLKRDPPSLVNRVGELLENKCSGSGLENGESFVTPYDLLDLYSRKRFLHLQGTRFDVVPPFIRKAFTGYVHYSHKPEL